MVEIETLSFSYGTREILKKVSHVFRKGIFTAIMGPNGSGKTTLLKNMAGLLKPESGSVKVKGSDLRDISISELSRIMAYVPQKSSSLPSATVTESVLAGRIPFIAYRETEKDKKISAMVIREMELSHIRNRNINEISGGELQKTLIAQALAKEPEILLLDEPLNNLDMKNQFEIMALLRGKTAEKNIMTVSVLHDLNSALKFCGELIFIKDGKIVFSGHPEKLSARTIREVFGVDCELKKEKDRIYALY